MASYPSCARLSAKKPARIGQAGPLSTRFVCAALGAPIGLECLGSSCPADAEEGGAAVVAVRSRASGSGLGASACATRGTLALVERITRAEPLPAQGKEKRSSSRPWIQRGATRPGQTSLIKNSSLESGWPTNSPGSPVAAAVGSRCQARMLLRSTCTPAGRQVVHRLTRAVGSCSPCRR